MLCIAEKTQLDLSIQLDSTPTTVDWRLDDYDSGRAILDWQSAAALQSQVISVPASANEVSRDLETRSLTVGVNRGLTGETHKQILYRVKNLVGV